jgi:hypothetical protein
MKSSEYLIELNIHLSHLYSFARQLNELDFAASLGGEFRGAQDAGWATTITANQVFEEFVALSNSKQPVSRMRLRHILMLYCQLAEAGGVYESLKNMMGVVTLKPYLLWPFKDLVRVRQAPKRVIGPNSNATFRDLAATAKDIGLGRLSSLLELAFRDDIRNGISHADYVIWNDGLRLRKRNGGYAELLSFDDVNEALTCGLGFFQMLREYNSSSVRSFDPPKTIVGRFSANIPMPWTVSFDPDRGSFGISGSSPGMVRSPEYDRQCQINGRLGGKVMALYTSDPTPESEAIEAHILSRGFEPHEVVLNESGLAELIAEIGKVELWDQRYPQEERSHALLLTPWGFRGVSTATDVDEATGKPLLDFKVT